MEKEFKQGSKLAVPNQAVKWELLDVLGAGASGKVYRAIQMGSDEEFAVKIVEYFVNYSGDPEELRNKEKYAERVENVVNKVKGFPHVVKYGECFRVPYDDENPEKGFYLIIQMEKLTPLEQYIKDRPSIMVRDAAKLGVQMCMALEECHRAGIIHRDIKPSNILVDSAGDYKLGDFGISFTRTKGQTVSMFQGTPEYIAPEVWEEKDYTDNIDTYSLGLVLYHLLGGVKPSVSWEKRIQGRPMPLLPGVGEPMMKILRRACHYRPKKRYSDPASMKLDLSNLTNEEGPAPETLTESSGWKKWAVLAASALALAAAVICGFVLFANLVALRELRMEPDSLQIQVGQRKKLDVYLVPEDSQAEVVSWVSSQPEIASVRDGLVTGNRVGSAVITAKSGSSEAACAVTVVSKPDNPKPVAPETIAVTEVRLDMDKAEIETEGEIRLRASILPENASVPEVRWSSDNPECASVDEGIVRGIRAGSAVIKAECGSVSAECMVTVVPKTVDEEKNQKAVQQENIVPVINTSQSSTEKPASVTESNSSFSGIQETVKEEPRVETPSGQTEFQIQPPKTIAVEGVSIQGEKQLQIAKGSKETLHAKVDPDNATDKTITWNSNNPAVASVTTEGVVMAVDTGTATIAASCSGKTDTCTVTVVIPVDTVRIEQDWLEITRGGDGGDLTAVVSPDNATHAEVSWTSDAPSIATVDNNGHITGVGKGRAVITASAGAASAACTVAVVVPVTQITLSESRLNLSTGQKRTLTASVFPADANDTTVTWSTGKSSVATVQDGTVTGVADGTATIIAKAGGISATCDVFVTTHWSDWVDSLPSYVDTRYETRTVYHYRDNQRETITSNQPSLPGYTLISTDETTGPMSDWSDTPQYASDTLHVEMRQVVDVPEHTEYCYGRWYGPGGRCWCKEYGEEQSGGTYVEQSTGWITTRGEYRDSEKGDWRCGKTDSQHTSHKGVDHIDAEGLPCWKRYFIGDDYYFWEETRQVAATYKTQYRSSEVYRTYSYERWVKGTTWSAWVTDYYEVDGISRDREAKTQYRYMIVT